MNIIVFVSGNGSNLQAMIDAQYSILPIKIVRVICNKKDAYAIERCKNAQIPCSVLIKKKEMARKDYEENILKDITKFHTQIDMVVLAGWMYILSDFFIQEIENSFQCPFINLHPALPGQFPGAHGIEDAYKAFKSGLIDKTGIMIHRVIPKIDAGEVIDHIEIPIYYDDSIDSLRQRIQYFEKPILLHSISKLLALSKKELILSGKPRLIYKGKVRNMYDMGYNLIALESTDRQSAFDRHICTIHGKGEILTQVSALWFNSTKHIIPNHYVYQNGDVMICKKAKRFDVEVVVRGYIAGSTSTSLWTHYSKGVRNYCGIDFPDGMIKNQKLPAAVVTPTTKDDKDEPISGEDIINRGLMTSDEWNYIKNKSLELYAFGVERAHESGLILVDTKYEFGKDINGNIILIDELHTCDSSRYWIESTYNDRFLKGENPDSLDKDVVRNYIISKCDPYNEPLPDIPADLVSKAFEAYKQFFQRITKREFYFLSSSYCETNSDDEIDPPPQQIDDIVKNYFIFCHKEKVALVIKPETLTNKLIPLREQLEREGVYTKIFTFNNDFINDDFNYTSLNEFPIIITESLELKMIVSNHSRNIVMSNCESNNLPLTVKTLLLYSVLN
jgi:phosphoribosylaminoimidazole-succinocarboxamide synthase